MVSFTHKVSSALECNKESDVQSIHNSQVTCSNKKAEARILYFPKKLPYINPLLMNHDMQRSRTLNYILIAGIALITLVKLSLCGSGFMAFPDEFRYKEAGLALKNFSQLNIKGGINAIFSTQGRPGDAIIKMIPNAVQAVTAKLFHLHHYESSNAYPLFFFNFLTYCFILFTHFKFSKLIFKDEFLSLLSVLIYSTMTNSYVYLRHGLSYDTSLAILYLVIYKLASYTEKGDLNLKRSFITGFVAFYGYLVYPGYFPLLFVGLFILFFNKLSYANRRKKIYAAGSHIAGIIICLCFFEGLSRLGGRSYISDAVTLSKTINLGLFDESFSFILSYLYQAEGLTGIMLVVSIIIFCFLVAWQIKQGVAERYRFILVLFIPVTGIFLAYASGGYFFHKMVFYGRLLHQYFPFIVLFCVFALNALFIKFDAKKELALTVLSFVFIINFTHNFIEYKAYVYPKDVWWTLFKTYNRESISEVCEHSDSWSDRPPEENDSSSSPVPVGNRSSHKIILVNGCTIFPANELSKYHLFQPGAGYVEIFSKPHFLGSRVYQFEGNDRTGRENLRVMNLQIKIFSLK